ncbi:MAG: glycosyltransferase family 4 protein [Pontiellaceae bacterium]|nr:glycosyltransferase family 4 protein [Pontiellaceae bacterium]
MKQNRKPIVALDLVPIRPGRGGTGSGIWTVVRELVLHLDQLDDFQGLEIICLINREQQAVFSNLRNIRTVLFPVFGQNSAFRLLWTHLFLPLWCLFRHVNLLHKPATETPFFCSARRVTTVWDFFHEFMQEHGADTRWAGIYFRWISSLCFKKSCAVIAGSDATRDEARRRFPGSRAVITTVYSGTFLPSAPLADVLPQDPFLILCVAKLMPYKGQLQALRVFETLLNNYPELGDHVRLVLHGFSNDEEYVRQLDAEIRREIFTGKVELRNYSAGKTLDEIYQNAGVLLFLSQYEGFGLPVIEAQSRGIPVVCSNLPVLREVGGDGALYVDRDDPQAAASALYDLIQNNTLRTRQIGAGLDNAKRFTWEKTARETLAVYAACVAE